MRTLEGSHSRSSCWVPATPWVSWIAWWLPASADLHPDVVGIGGGNQWMGDQAPFYQVSKITNCIITALENVSTAPGGDFIQRYWHSTMPLYLHDVCNAVISQRQNCTAETNGTPCKTKITTSGPVAEVCQLLS